MIKEQKFTSHEHHYTHTHPHTHLCTHPLTHTHTHTHAYPHVHTCTLTCTHAHPPTYLHSISSMSLYQVYTGLSSTDASPDDVQIEKRGRKHTLPTNMHCLTWPMYAKRSQCTCYVHALKHSDGTPSAQRCNSVTSLAHAHRPQGTPFVSHARHWCVFQPNWDWNSKDSVTLYNFEETHGLYTTDVWSVHDWKHATSENVTCEKHSNYMCMVPKHLL